MRTPVHFVTGDGAREWAATALANRPGWAVCQSAGCPCCVGRVMLQVTLARLLREQRPERVLVVALAHTHEDAALAMLREPPLGDYVIEGRPIRLPQDAALAPEALDRA